MKNWKIRYKLLALTSVLIGFIVLTAGFGYSGMQSTVRGLETVYLDRVVPLRDLKFIADMYAVNIVDASHKARAGTLTHAEALQQIEEAQSAIAERWKAYIATRLTAEEEKVVGEVGPMLTAAEAPLQRLKSILGQGDAEALAAFTAKDLYPLIDPLSEAFAGLIDIQLVEAKREYDAGEDTFHSNLIFNLVLTVLALIIGAALSAVVTRQITRQLGAEPGDLELVATDIANGRLAGVSGDRGAAIGVMASVERMRGNLHELVAQIAGDSKRLGTNAATLASASEQVCARTEMQGEASASMAAALEEMSVSIARIADSTDEAERVAAHANETGQAGLQVIQAAVQDFDHIDRLMSDSAQRVNRLSDDSKSIGTIGSVIREIADQTNLLALNAAIEAARAGEQGRGFAVVADEVRKLAERTSASTAEIVQLVTTIQEGTSSTREQMNAVCGQVAMSKQHIREAGETMADLRDALGQTLMNVESISLSLNEQRIASTEVASRVEQVAQAVEETSATQKEIGLAAQDLDRLAIGLNSMVARFSL